MKVFIGWDKRETVAYHVACQSVIEKTDNAPLIAPIGNDVLPSSEWWRPIGPYDTTDFSNARFMVPFKSGYEGWSLFMDPDILVLKDIRKLYALRDDRYAVMCVQHEYTPKGGVKAMGEQTIYSKKNWSSVMLFNNVRCRKLTTEYVNSANGLDLHQFKWLHPNEVGSLPKDWNHLVGEYPPNENVSIVHYTLGGPYMEGYEHTEYSEEWSQAYARSKQVEGGSYRV